MSPRTSESVEAAEALLGEVPATIEVDFESAVGDAVPADVESVLTAGSVQARRARRRRLTLAVVVTDLAALCAASFVGATASGLAHGVNSWSASALAIAYAPVFLPLFSLYGLYRRAGRRLVDSIFPDLAPLLHATLIGCLVLAAASSTLHRYLGLTPLGIGGSALVGGAVLVTVPVSRRLIRVLLHPDRTRSRAVVVGSGRVAAVVLQRLRAVPGMEIVGYVDDGVSPAVEIHDIAKLGRLEDLSSVVRREAIDHIVVAFTPVSGAELAGVLRSLADEVKISIVPRLFDLLTVRSRVDDLHGLPVVDVAPAVLGTADRFAKRAMDLVLSASGLVVTLPLTVAVALLVKLTSPGPVLFRQERSGREGTTFSMLKFRTMYVDAEARHVELTGSNEADGPLFKLHRDPRVTPIGAWLRRSSLDELPQLFNVLTGRMSLVGPRPLVISEARQIRGWAERRFAVRPGLTGLWQVSGRSDLPFDELCRLDYSYVASWSLAWDLRILWHTPSAVIRRRGAY
jgi:exopolysaccharide biosynthesis polyprenyl glycosylphosphotransferase